MLESKIDAYHLLEKLGASAHLLLHLRLVDEAAQILILTYTKLGLNFDAKLIELGVAIHDAGKIIYPHELNEAGSQHESAGEILLLSCGVQAKIAKCCITHAKWQNPEVTLEEKTVALADKLWKGKREEKLELSIIDEIAFQLGINRWIIFELLDSVFEEIANDGFNRLCLSQNLH